MPSSPTASLPFLSLRGRHLWPLGSPPTAGVPTGLSRTLPWTGCEDSSKNQSKFEWSRQKISTKRKQNFHFIEVRADVTISKRRKTTEVDANELGKSPFIQFYTMNFCNKCLCPQYLKNGIKIFSTAVGITYSSTNWNFTGHWRGFKACY